MEKFFTLLKESVESGKDVMIVGISEVSGSAPRGAGAKMLITENGRICGTIGGGSVEHKAKLHAIALLKEKSSDMQSFRLSPNNIRDLGMVCGGEVSIYFNYISSDNLNVVELSNRALSKIKNGEVSWLIICVTGSSSGGMWIYGEKEKASFIEIDGLSGLSFADTPQKQNKNGCEYLVEPLVRAGIVYIFGGGHVSQALVPVAAKVGFRCAVFDDRDEFTKPELFPGAAKVGAIDFMHIEKAVDISKNDYILIITRGHQYDSALQAQAMRTAARYIGVMGSKNKIAHVSKQMRELGFTDLDLARVKSPIGLDIKAETPDELAISIVAELIVVRAGCPL